MLVGVWGNGPSEPSVAGGNVNKGSFSREDQTELLKLCISCGPVTLLKGTGEDGPSTVHGSQELEVTQVPTKGGSEKKSIAHTRALKVTNRIYKHQYEEFKNCVQRKK